MNTIIKIKFVFLFILCAATLPVSSHPGRTDSYGGHWNHKTGEYHYHDGKYAGREQSGSTSKKEEKLFTPPREPETKSVEDSKKDTKAEPIGKTEKEEKKGTSSAGFYVISILAGIVVLVSLCAYIHDYIQDHTTKLIKKYDESLKRTISCITEGIGLKKKLSKTPAPIPPEGVEIGEDGLPKETGSKGWGKSFTGYRTTYGYKIHYKKGCSGSYKKEHLYYHRNSRCLICYRNIPLPDFSWYDSYKKVALVKNEIKNNSEYFESCKKELIELHTQCNYSKNKSLMSKRQKLTLEYLNIQYDLVLELL